MGMEFAGMSSTSRAAITAVYETSTSCPAPGGMAQRASEQRFHVRSRPANSADSAKRRFESRLTKVADRLGQLALQTLRWRMSVGRLVFGCSIVLAAILTVAPHAVHAQNLSWSPNCTDLTTGCGGSGGSGNWSTTSTDLFWFDGTILRPWVNSPPALTPTSANFGGAAGTVNVIAPITVQNITFATDAYRIQGGALTLFGVPGANSTISADSAITGTIASVLEGSAGLIKAGPGMVVLEGINTYAGGTTITGGVLSIGSEDNLGTGNITLNGGTLLTTGAVIDSRAISLPATIGNGTIDNGGKNDTFSGAITGPGGLTLNGSGTTILTNTNPYQGGTTINGGTLSISNNASIGAGAVPLTINSGTLATTATITGVARPLTITGGATFDVAAGTTFNLNSAITAANGGGNPITKTNTTGTLQLGGNNTVGGAVTIGGGTLEFTESGTSTYSGVISGAGSLLQS